MSDAVQIGGRLPPPVVGLFIRFGVPCLLLGPSGTGKTEFVRNLVRHPPFGSDAHFIHWNMSALDSTDIEPPSVPQPDGKPATLLRPDVAAAIRSAFSCDVARRPLLFFLDELTAASQAVQGAVLSPLTTNQIAMYELGKGLFWCAAGNDVSQSELATDLGEQISSRFLIVRWEYDVKHLNAYFSDLSLEIVAQMAGEDADLSAVNEALERLGGLPLSRSHDGWVHPPLPDTSAYADCLKMAIEIGNAALASLSGKGRARISPRVYEQLVLFPVSLLLLASRDGNWQAHVNPQTLDVLIHETLRAASADEEFHKAFMREWQTIGNVSQEDLLAFIAGRRSVPAHLREHLVYQRVIAGRVADLAMSEQGLAKLPREHARRIWSFVARLPQIGSSGAARLLVERSDPATRSLLHRIARYGLLVAHLGGMQADVESTWSSLLDDQQREAVRQAFAARQTELIDAARQRSKGGSKPGPLAVEAMVNFLSTDLQAMAQVVLETKGGMPFPYDVMATDYQSYLRYLEYRGQQVHGDRVAQLKRHLDPGFVAWLEHGERAFEAMGGAEVAARLMRWGEAEVSDCLTRLGLAAGRGQGLSW